LRPFVLTLAIAALTLPAAAQTAAPSIPSALSDKRAIVASKDFGTYSVYRVKGEARRVTLRESYPYTAEGIWESYTTVDCPTGWTLTEQKNHERWLTPFTRYLPSKASPSVLASFRRYCTALGIKPGF